MLVVFLCSSIVNPHHSRAFAHLLKYYKIIRIISLFQLKELTSHPSVGYMMYVMQMRHASLSKANNSPDFLHSLEKHNAMMHHRSLDESATSSHKCHIKKVF